MQTDELMEVNLRNETANIAVIGCGYWGKNLVRNFHQLGALRWICDADEVALRTHSTIYSDIRTTSKIEDVLADPNVQGVVIAVPAVATQALATWVLPEPHVLKRAACVPIAAGTAADCLFEFGRLQAGETVLVHAGAGGLGMAAIQLAKRAGATVLATASSHQKLERLKKLGLDHGINYRDEDFVARTKALTGGRGADLVVDSIGGLILQQSFDAAAYRGRIITVGSAGRDAERPETNLLRQGNKSLTGVFLGAELFLNPGRVRPMIAGLLEDVASGTLQIVIDREWPLSEAAAAHRYIEDRKAFGRVLLIP